MSETVKILFLLIFIFFARPEPAHAQLGDNKDPPNLQQVDPIPMEKIPPSPALTLNHAMKSFRLRDGFVIEPVAIEPLVQDPVHMSFDHSGKLWVVEMSGYMTDLEGSKESLPLGKVVVLEDKNGDGTMDTRHVFAEKLKMPRSVFPTTNGTLVIDPPLLLLLKDNNRDLKSDQTIILDKNFTNHSNPEHEINSFVWRYDNWIYSAKNNRKFRLLSNDTIKTAPTYNRGQWGLSQDDLGRLYFNFSEDHLRTELISWDWALHLFPQFKAPSGLDIQVTSDQSIFPARSTPGVNRAYMPGVLSEHKIKKFTAACSPLIYRGNSFPSTYDNDAFVAEPAGNLVKHVDLNTKGRHPKTLEFLASTDERFRPVHLIEGPDGAIYVADMYRGVIQHKTYMTSYLRKQIDRRSLLQPQNYGRIYRIRPKNKTLEKNDFSNVDWIKQLTSSSGWWRNKAQQLLIENFSHNQTISAQIQGELKKTKSWKSELSILWTLLGMNTISPQQLIDIANKSNNWQTKSSALWALREQASPETPSLFHQLLPLLYYKNSEVKKQLLFLLHAGGPKERIRLLSHFLENEFILDDVTIDGVALQLLNELHLSKFQLEISLRESDFNKKMLSSLLKIAISQKMDSDVVSYFKKKSEVWIKNVVAEHTSLVTQNSIKNRIANNLSRILFKTKAMFFKKYSNQDSKELGIAVYKQNCIMCHQSHGMGVEGLAPPLKGSSFVLGTEENLIRIAINGLTGPYTHNGKTYDLVMPGFQFLNNQQISAVLSHIRNEWGNNGATITPEKVENFRKVLEKRSAPWTTDELNASK